MKTWRQQNALKPPVAIAAVRSKAVVLLSVVNSLFAAAAIVWQLVLYLSFVVVVLCRFCQVITLCMWDVCLTLDVLLVW